MVGDDGMETHEPQPGLRRLVAEVTRMDDPPPWWIEPVEPAALEAELRAAIERVHDAWLEEVGDLHDAWSTDDLVAAVMAVVKREAM